MFLSSTYWSGEAGCSQTMGGFRFGASHFARKVNRKLF